MTEDAIAITAGASDIEPGTYFLTLIEIGGPRTETAKRGPNAGEEFSFREWTFAFEDGSELTDSASLKSGPKSKTYKWTTALLGGTPPPAGTAIPKSQLIGRMVQASIVINEDGWPKIDGLIAMPRAKAAPAAPAPRARPVPITVEAASDEPF
jgi:hypothetical protein